MPRLNVHGFTISLAFGGLMLSCSSEEQNTVTSNLEGIRGSDTLFIAGYFDDCEEWGGHSETIRVFRTQGEIVRAEYERDTVNCPNPDLFNRRVIERKLADLNPEQQALVVSFAQEVVERSFDEERLGNAGNTYSVSRPPFEFGGLQAVYRTEAKWHAFEDLKKKLLSTN
jgi:hypothetical protein